MGTCAINFSYSTSIELGVYCDSFFLF